MKKYKFQIIVIGAISLIVILGAFFVISLHDQQIQQKQIQQEAQKPKVEIKNIPSDNDSDSNNISITQVKGKSNIKSAINFGFHLIAETKSVSGSGMDLTQISNAETNQLNSIFVSTDVVQKFNDLVNVSSNNGDLTIGDASSGVKTIYSAKAGTSYVVDSCFIDYQQTSNGNYVYNVDLKYHPKHYAKESIKLIIEVDKTTGKVTNIVQRINS